MVAIMRILYTSLITNLLVFWVKPANSRPAEAQPDDEKTALDYLEKFGYMNQSDISTRGGFFMGEDVLKTAVREFQEFANLNPTGQLDKKTVRMMKVPRCGVKDKRKSSASLRLKRYVLEGSKWRTTDLTYAITKYPNDLKRSEVDEEVRKAFDSWSEVTPLKFTKRSSGGRNVNLEIRFERGNHDDGDPFDGPGRTLAHAFFPGSGGDIHFDNDETWTVKTDRGTNLFQVAVHEFGHALGLEHSKVESAIMYPFYRGYLPNFKFDDDDVEGIQALYGARNERESDNTLGKSGTNVNDGQLCGDGKLDAIIDIAGSVYVLKGSHTWKLDPKIGAPAGHPTLISEMWQGLPSNIDAAFTGTNGKVYFFKGNMFWKYNGRNLDSGYPKTISEGFPGIPNNVDAALWWTPLGNAYFFKDKRYWVYNPNAKPNESSTYPQPISTLTGIPNDLDDALYTNDRIYFFKNGKYYRFNEKTFKVDTGNPSYPRDAKYYWFGCKQ